MDLGRLGVGVLSVALGAAEAREARLDRHQQPSGEEPWRDQRACRIARKVLQVVV